MKHVTELTVDELQAVQLYCGVCVGRSPHWDGHDMNPPCVGAARAEIIRRARMTPPAPARAENSDPTRCVFDMCWVGRCSGTAGFGAYEEFCEKHAAVVCHCGQQAVKDCEQTMGAFVCGSPSCAHHRCKWH